MPFAGLDPSISSLAELFWHLLVVSEKPNEKVEAKPPTISVPDKGTKQFFALIIGINEYDQDIGPLGGCVKDATDVRNYLLTDLKVHESQIIFLTDKKAKRADIIKGFLDLQNDTRIKKDDPILIFYAGHGDETDAPPGWPSGDVDNKIQMIIPQDYSKNPAKQVHGIPDHTLAALLNGIAKEHGENITVIFDCCNSGSGTRGRKVRAINRSQSQQIPPTLDNNIWSAAAAGATRGSSTAPEFPRKGLANHVLLAACTQKELASDGSGAGGAFTQALLPTLKSTGADKLTYLSLLDRIDKIPSQNPQCEGNNQHHFMFDAKAPPTGRVCFPVTLRGAAFELKAGSAQGVTEGSEFSLYNDSLTIDESTPLAILVVKAATDIGPFTTTLKIKPPSTAVITSFPKTACGLQTKAGEAEDLVLYAPLDDRLIELYKKLAKLMKDWSPGDRQIRLVEERDKARLGLSIVDNKIAFDIIDPFLEGYGLTRIPQTVKNDPDEIIPVLHAAAHFYWHLNRRAKDVLVDEFIDIECNTLLISNNHDSSGNAILKPTGENLFKAGVIDVVASVETVYGFKITNRSERDLYISAFYFDNTDFSIVSYYQSPRSGQFASYPTLPKKGGYLTIGYGSGGASAYSYQLDDGVDIDVGYLLFFIASENIDLSTIPQKTPFKRPPGRRPVPKPIPQKPVYGTILVPIIQRRKAL